LEEERQRRAAEKARKAAEIERLNILNDQAVQERIRQIARAREEAKRARQEAKKKKNTRHPLQDLWDRNGAAIYEANKQFKATHGKNMDSSTRKKAIKDATVGGVFSAGAYAGNLNQVEKERKIKRARILIPDDSPRSPEVPAQGQSLKDRVLSFKEKILNPPPPPPPKKPAYVPPNVSWKQADLAAADKEQKLQDNIGDGWKPYAPNPIGEDDHFAMANRFFSQIKEPEDKISKVAKSWWQQSWNKIKYSTKQIPSSNIDSYTYLKNLNPPSWISISVGPSLERDLFSSEYVGWSPGTGGFWKCFFFEKQTLNISSSETGTRNPNGLIDVNLANGKLTFNLGKKLNVFVQPGSATIGGSIKHKISVDQIDYTEDTIAYKLDWFSTSWISAHSEIHLNVGLSNENFRVIETDTVSGNVRKIKGGGPMLILAGVGVFFLGGEFAPWLIPAIPKLGDRLFGVGG